MKLKPIFVTLASFAFELIQVANGDVRVSKPSIIESTAGSNDRSCILEQPQCKFYIAPSSIPNAGFGVYTTEAIKKDQYLMESDAPSVMIFDGDTHYPEDRLWSMEHYFWSGEGKGQFECHSVEEFVVTFGTSCNFHTYLKNVAPEEAEYSDTLNSRKDGSPGIGAYSYHGGSRFMASRDIAAGEEIFADYGEHWLDSRGFDEIPREEDFNKAGAVILKLLNGMKDEDITGKHQQKHLIFAMTDVQ